MEGDETSNCLKKKGRRVHDVELRGLEHLYFLLFAVSAPYLRSGLPPDRFSGLIVQSSPPTPRARAAR